MFLYIKNSNGNTHNVHMYIWNNKFKIVVFFFYSVVVVVVVCELQRRAIAYVCVYVRACVLVAPRVFDIGSSEVNSLVFST